MTKIYDLISEVGHNLAPDTELLGDDFAAAVFTMTDIAVLMDIPIDEVLERVKGHYRVSLDDKRDGIGIWEDQTVEEKQLRIAVMRACNLGAMADDEILKRVRGALDRCEAFRHIAAKPKAGLKPELKLVTPEPTGPDWLRG